ncbi:MAG: alpha/beta hydrolase [Kineosporiaceae bacterium]
MTVPPGTAAVPGRCAPPLDDDVRLTSGLRLAIRTTRPAEGVPVTGGALLVHGLASNARLWDGVAAVLAAAGVVAVAVDLRGHGRSADLALAPAHPGEAAVDPATGYDTPTCAADLADLVALLTASGGLPARPLVAGQSWGAHVTALLAADHGDLVGALACVDGGWLRPSAGFATFEECWAVLAPPSFEGMRWDDLAARITAGHDQGWPPGAADAVLANLRPTGDGGVRAALLRERHRSILESLYREDPRPVLARVGVPALLCPTVAGRPRPGESEREAAGRALVLEALDALPRGRVSWYPGAHHDVHLQRPADIAADLLSIAAEGQA